MTDETLLRDPAAPLRAFSAGLGDQAPDWAAREELEQLRYRREDVDRDMVAALTLDHLLPMAEAYGGALRLRFLLGAMPVLEVGPDLDGDDLTAFREDTADSPTVTLDLILDKDALLQSWLEDVPGQCRPFLYLFPRALERLLSVPPDKLGDLEALLWGGAPHAKALILVPDHHIWLDGPYLAVVGGDGIGRWREALPPVENSEDLEGLESGSGEDGDEEPDQELAFIVETRADLLKWDEPWVEALTPLHLKLAGEGGPGDGPIAALLEGHLVNLVLLYTADRTRRRQGHPWATYAGAEVSVELPLLRTDRATDIPTGQGAADLLGIFEWAYDPGFHGDKLPLLQIGVARALRAADARVRPRLLVQNGPAILEGLRYHWKALLESKVDAYVSQVRALEEYVDETTQAFADEVSDVIDDLTKNVLAAVGVVVGSVVGSLFKETFNPLILSIGMGIYALYIFFLPLRFGMRHRWEAYQALGEEFAERRHRFEALLYEGRVEEIVGDRVDDSQRRFERWYAKARRAYVILIAAALLVAAVALAWALLSGAGSAATSPIPTPTVPAP